MLFWLQSSGCYCIAILEDISLAVYNREFGEIKLATSFIDYASKMKEVSTLKPS